jgi:hypothetical protein
MNLPQVIVSFSCHLKVHLFSPIDRLSDIIDLSNLPRLSSIRFGPKIATFRRQNHIHFLAQIISCEIREVAMHFWLIPLNELTKIDWDGIARVLQRPNFSGLEKVSILDVMLKDARAWLLQRLPPGRMRDKVVCQ